MSALADSRSPDPEVRYRAAMALGDQPGEASEQRLVELLSDDGVVEVEPADFMRDEPVYGYVAHVAMQSLVQLRAWRTLLDAVPRVDASTARSCLHHVISAGAELATWSDEELARLIERAVEHGLPGPTIGDACAERDLAPRARGLAPEAFWRLRLVDHPIPSKRAAALARLATLVEDRAAFALEVVELLRSPDETMRKTAAGVLARLPPVLPDAVVHALATSELVRTLDDLLGALARHGAPAAALVPLCLEMLQQPRLGDHVVTIATDLENRRWRRAAQALVALGPAAAAARPILVERLLASDETMSIQGSFRGRLFDALGGVEQARAEVEPAIAAALASGDARRVRIATEVARWLAPAQGARTS